ncbi:MAG: hypothetical protein QME65_02145, partial [Candidatus Omnitrophota bacterium]|nr:hypothetical protein [Candidatus Omnitrophota bacterium]
MVKLKAQSAKRKTKIKNLKFLVLSFSFTFFALHFALIGSLAFAQPVSSTELIENAQAYDGKRVAYAGEVIGDIMRRGNFAWLNV